MKIRLTEKRIKLLNILKQNDGALSAKEIHTKLPYMDLVTIYRNLDLFAKEKLINKVHLGGDEILYEYQPEPHHHAVCNDCDRIIHFKASNEKIKKLLNLEDFEVAEIEVIVRGVCKKK